MNEESIPLENVSPPPSVKYLNFEQGSQEWLKAREGLYSGTTADKLLKFGKIEYALNHLEKPFRTFYTDRSKILEPDTIKLFTFLTYFPTIQVGLVLNTNYPDCCFSPDRLVRLRSSYPNILVEVKNFSESKHLELIHAKTVTDLPFKILAQIYFGMLICRTPTAFLLPFNPQIKNPIERFKVIKINQNKLVENNFKRILGEGK